MSTIEDLKIQNLLEEKEILKTKIASDSLNYKDAIIYCKKTMEIQEEEIRRLEERILMDEKLHKEKLASFQKENTEIVENLKTELDRMKGEHLLMTTQIGNQQQLELEMAEMQKVLETLKKELAAKEEKMNLREIREREIALVTEQRVREEIKKEFDSEVAKIAKQLKIQNAAQMEANHYIIKKLNKENEDKKIKIQTCQMKLNEITKELNETKKDIVNLENDKKRLEDHLNKAREQSEKLLKESRKQLEESEKIRSKENAKNQEIIVGFKKEMSEMKKKLKKLEEEKIEKQKNLEEEINLRKKTLEKHADQNQKLKDLQEFLKIVLEDNNDDYIDAILGENRVALFAKLSLLLQRIPIVQ